jgi:LPS O-antigen subunit length determinant protein (WzzB/FepE family)
MKLQERTPVFKVIDPARVPLRKSRPNTRVIFAIMLFMGFMAGAGIIITKYFVERMINK